MKISEIKDMLAETGLPVTYLQWQEQGVPELPYICWLMPNSENFGADNKVYKEVEVLNIELYTRQRSFALEASVEAVLDSHGLFWDKDSSWIDSEAMNETIYTAEIYVEAETTSISQEENDGE